MPRRYIVVLKLALWFGCLTPFALLVYDGFANPAALGADPVARITHTTGFWTLWLLAATLAITPVRRLHPRLNWLIRFRRPAGLFAFFYACMHLLTYIWLYSGFDVSAMIADIEKRRFITVGLLAWLLLLPLALSSTAWSIRKLGGLRWRRLHMLVYAAAVAGVVHYWWGVKQGVWTPLDVTLVIGGVLLARVTYRWMRPSPLPRPTPAGAASSRAASPAMPAAGPRFEPPSA